VFRYAFIGVSSASYLQEAGFQSEHLLPQYVGCDRAEPALWPPPFDGPTYRRCTARVVLSKIRNTQQLLCMHGDSHEFHGSGDGIVVGEDVHCAPLPREDLHGRKLKNSCEDARGGGGTGVAHMVADQRCRRSARGAARHELC